MVIHELVPSNDDERMKEKGEREKAKKKKNEQAVGKVNEKKKSFGCFHWVTMRVRLYAPSAPTRYLGTFTTLQCKGEKIKKTCMESD
jgi:hypothetical protein